MVMCCKFCGQLNGLSVVRNSGSRNSWVAVFPSLEIMHIQCPLSCLALLANYVYQVAMIPLRSCWRFFVVHQTRFFLFHLTLPTTPSFRASKADKNFSLPLIVASTFLKLARFPYSDIAFVYSFFRKFALF